MFNAITLKEKMKIKSNLILFMLAISFNSQCKIQDSYTKNRLARHKKTDLDYINETFVHELELLNKSNLARKERAKESNLNMAEYFSNNNRLMTEFKMKLKNCNSDLIKNRDDWQALNNFIKEYAKINEQYNKETIEIHQDYTSKIEQAQNKRDNSRDQARIKAVNLELSEIKNSLIDQNNNQECINLIEKLCADLKVKRIDGLNKFINSENKSRKKYLQSKKELNKIWSQKTSCSRNKKYQEHQEITLSSKKNLLQRTFNKS